MTEEEIDPASKVNKVVVDFTVLPSAVVDEVDGYSVYRVI
jgi:hypothetical protein